MSIFSDNIRSVRNKRKLSQESLAKLLGITRSNIASYEGDKNIQPPFTTLVLYSDFFGVTIDELIKNKL